MMGRIVNVFNEAEIEQDHKAAEPAEETVFAKPRGRKTQQPDVLAEEEVLLTLPEDRLVCSATGGSLRAVEKKFVRRELRMVSQKVSVLVYYTLTYECDRCKSRDGHIHRIEMGAPVPLLKRSLASPYTVADIMANKYVDGLSLIKQERAWAKAGVELSRATMANWVMECAQTWLKPLYRHMKQCLLEQPAIHAAESSVLVPDDAGSVAASDARMRVYTSGVRSEKPVRLYEYQSERSGKRPEAFLRGFTGCLVTNGDRVYGQVKGVTRCGCWAHMWELWRDAVEQGAADEVAKAEMGLRLCEKVFAMEKKCGSRQDKYRREYRQTFLVPVLEEYFCWVNTVKAEKDSRLAKAVSYALEQREALSVFLDHGELSAHNIVAENALAPFRDTGRKGWVFMDTAKGAELSAIIYSIVETAQVNHIDPRGYLLLVLSSLRFIGKSPSHEVLESLMPWSKETQQRFVQ